MEEKPAPIHPHLTGGGVPDELMKRLHEANERFCRGCARMEAEMESPEEDRDTRVDRVAEEVRAAERDVEAVNQEIKEYLEKSTAKMDKPQDEVEK